jgi:hypothetical protein
VEHHFCSKEDGMDYWWTGTVISYNPVRKQHTIQYDYVDDEEDVID